jgi:hypothetical protein
MLVAKAKHDDHTELHVYFHIDELARDAVVASALRYGLEEKGGQLFYGNRFVTDCLLRYHNPFDAIILPSLLHFYGAFPDANHLPNNVFILQTEAIGQSTKTLKRLNGKYFGDDAEKYAPWHNAVRGYLLWGPAHLNPFHEYHPEYLPKCRVVGHPRLSKYCKGVRPSRSGNPVIGFVSRFNLLSPFDGRTAFESVTTSMRAGNKFMGVYEGSGDKDVEDMFYTEVIDFRIMLQIMRALDANTYDITVRPHPRENRHGWQRIAKKLGLKITVSDWDVPFSHWLAQTDYIVTPPSTSLYDIFYHGQHPIVIDKLVPSRANHTLAQSDDNNSILEAVCRPTTIEELIRRIETDDIPHNQTIVHECLQQQVGSAIASESIANIIGAIEEFLPLQGKAVAPWKIRLWECMITVLSEIRDVRRILRRRPEQGASFNLTLRRRRWIRRLAHSA